MDTWGSRYFSLTFSADDYTSLMDCQFLIRSRINPDIYLTDIFRPAVREAVRLSLESGAEIYVK